MHKHATQMARPSLPQHNQLDGNMRHAARPSCQWDAVRIAIAAALRIGFSSLKALERFRLRTFPVRPRLASWGEFVEWRRPQAGQGDLAHGSAARLILVRGETRRKDVGREGPDHLASDGRPQREAGPLSRRKAASPRLERRSFA